MSTETIVLLSNANDDSQPSSWQYSEKNRGAGYYQNSNGIHTAVFEFDNFKGSVKIQATLELYPSDSDWFDVVYDDSATQLEALDSTPLVTSAVRNFTGKFVFIRVAYMLEQGTITEIRYNH